MKKKRKFPKNTHKKNKKRRSLAAKNSPNAKSLVQKLASKRSLIGKVEEILGETRSKCQKQLLRKRRKKGLML